MIVRTHLRVIQWSTQLQLLDIQNKKRHKRNIHIKEREESPHTSIGRVVAWLDCYVVLVAAATQKSLSVIDQFAFERSSEKTSKQKEKKIQKRVLLHTRLKSRYFDWFVIRLKHKLLFFSSSSVGWLNKLKEKIISIYFIRVIWSNGSRIAFHFVMQ